MALSTVFDETYRNYLRELKNIHLPARAESLGVKVEKGGLLIPLYDKIYRLSGSAITDRHGVETNPAVRVILARYVLNCPSRQLPTGPDRLMSYREFPDAAPLISYFTTTTNKAIETRFSGGVDRLRVRGLELGGKEEANESYDLSLQFFALPRIPVLLNFNDRDDLFPAACSVLYRQSARHYLDMECLAMTGSMLADRLIRA